LRPLLGYWLQGINMGYTWPRQTIKGCQADIFPGRREFWEWWIVRGRT
jgi:hypothetical protein